MLFKIMTVVYVLVCLLLIVIVLLQSGKGGGLGSALGGGSAGQQIFGGAGAGNVLTRVTSVLAAMFMLLSAGLSYVSSGGEQALERAVKDSETSEVALPPDSAPEAPDDAVLVDVEASSEAEESNAAEGDPEAEAPAELVEPAADVPAAVE